VLHSLNPLGYVRYGDDFVLWFPDELSASSAQIIGTQFLADELKLPVNYKHDRVQPTQNKLAYLGVELWPNGRQLNQLTQHRIDTQLMLSNSASYRAITYQHLPKRYRKRFLWNVLDILDEI